LNIIGFLTCSRNIFSFNIWGKNSEQEKSLKWVFTMVKAFTVSILILVFYIPDHNAFNIEKTLLTGALDPGRGKQI
jgi:hypothetical protein